MKSALITGANKSIGLEIAKQLSKKGILVYLGSRDIEKGEDAVKTLTGEGFQNIKAIEIDVTKPDTILSARNIIEKEQGKLDILINNAGINGGLPQTALTASVDRFKEVYETNVFGIISVTQTFIDLLKKSPEPRIVNVSSSQGSLTLASDPDYKYYQHKGAIYQSSKSALNMYTIALAYELRDTAFKVNSVDPGFTKTDFNHHHGTGTVEEAGERIVKYALTDANGPTGKYFSEDVNPETGEIPW